MLQEIDLANVLQFGKTVFLPKNCLAVTVMYYHMGDIRILEMIGYGMAKNMLRNITLKVWELKTLKFLKQIFFKIKI